MRSNNVLIPAASSLWSADGDNIYYKGGNVGVGINTPNSKLEVQGDTSFSESDTLFSVKDRDGDVVFAVFPDGARVYVNDTASKAKVGGFAVAEEAEEKQQKMTFSE